MKPRVYYGQYTLKYWIELMLSGNIICPPYQRRFVWSENAVKTMINSLKNNMFIPPVTVGVLKKEETSKGKKSKDKNFNQSVNYIIDGQQRLTSILLAYLCLFPIVDKKEIHKEIEYASDSDTDTSGADAFLDWQFSELLNLADDTNSLYEEAIKSGAYTAFHITGINEDFFTTHYLGFSYIVPDVDNTEEQQAFYSELFRNMNTLGTPLTPQQSRKSLYFLKSDLEPWCDPEFCKEIFITVSSVQRRYLDFVRYLAILAAYNKADSKVDAILVGYGRGKVGESKKSMESFYRNYIDSIVAPTEELENIFGNFKNIFQGKHMQRIKNLLEAIHYLGLEKIQYSSIIDLDIFFFGLIHYIIYEDKIRDFLSLSEEKKNSLLEKLNHTKDSLRAEGFSTKNAAQIGKLRSRITSSIAIYQEILGL